MGRGNTWQYHLIYQPGTIASTFRVAGLHASLGLITWDQWADDPVTHVQPEWAVLDALWRGATEALERHSHKG